MPDSQECRSSRRQQGGVGVRIVLAVSSLAVLIGVVLIVIGNYQHEQQAHHRRAAQVSEYGLLQGLQLLQENREWRGPIDHSEYQDGWYSVTVKPGDSAGVALLTLTAEGHSGSSVRRQICVLSHTPAETVWVQQSIKQE